MIVNPINKLNTSKKTSAVQKEMNKKIKRFIER